MKTKGLFVLIAPLLWVMVYATPAMAQPSGVEEASLPAFSAELETIRQALNIPGWSAAIVSEQEIIWAEGFGYADVD